MTFDMLVDGTVTALIIGSVMFGLAGIYYMVKSIRLWWEAKQG